MLIVVDSTSTDNISSRSSVVVIAKIWDLTVYYCVSETKKHILLRIRNQEIDSLIALDKETRHLTTYECCVEITHQEYSMSDKKGSQVRPVGIRNLKPQFVGTYKHMFCNMFLTVNYYI